MSQSNTNSLRVLSYNIHKGFSHTNRRYLLDEIRRSMRLINADVLFLQEVIGRHDKHAAGYHDWADDAQLEYLADSVWSHFAYGKNSIYDHGHHGNAILSKFPFMSWKNTDISCVKKSHRGILSGQLSNDVQVLCTHFGLFPKEHRFQSDKLIKLIHDNMDQDTPLLLCGDFNDWKGDTHKQITEHLHLEEAYFSIHDQLPRTFPAIRPLFALDRIYFRGMKVKECELLSGKPWKNLSDHCALYAEFQW